MTEEAKRGPGRPPKSEAVSADETPATIDCVVKRAWWDKSGERHNVGDVVPVPVEDAMDGVERGYFARHR